MSDTTQLWLMRHGETEWSLNGKHTGRTDIPLTDNGREQARRAGAYLAARPFALVLVSPMARAQETCRLAGYGSQAIVDPNLLEWNYGDCEGRTTAEIRATQPGWSVWKDPCPGGETPDQVGLRTDALIARALAAEGPVALFAHAHIFRILAARWIGLPALAGSNFGLSTGSVSVLAMERESHIIDRWNRTFTD